DLNELPPAIAHCDREVLPVEQPNQSGIWIVCGGIHLCAGGPRRTTASGRPRGHRSSRPSWGDRGRGRRPRWAASLDDFIRPGALNKEVQRFPRLWRSSTTVPLPTVSRDWSIAGSPVTRSAIEEHRDARR